MLSTDDLFREIAVMEKVYENEKDEYKKAMLKAEILNLKLQQNMRSNIVTIMKFWKIDNTNKKRFDAKKPLQNTVL